MLIQPTLDALNRLKLYGMAAALTEQLTQSAAHGLAFEERFGLLVERELVHRENRRLSRLLQIAALKERACLSGAMAIVAQLVRALVCGTRGRGFKTPRSPHFSLQFQDDKQLA